MRYFALLGVALLLVVGCVKEVELLRQQASKQPTVESYLALGIHQLKANQYEAAVESFRQAVKIEPSSPQAHHNLGVAYVRLGRNREALEEFRLSHRLKPEYQKLLLPLVPPGISAGARSLEELRDAAASSAGDVHADFDLGQGYLRANLLDEAVAQYQKVLAQSPRHAGAHYGLGSAFAQLSRYDDSIESLQQAIRLKPTWATPHYTLGLVYLLRGDVNDAFQEYKILREINVRLADNLFTKIYE